MSFDAFLLFNLAEELGAEPYTPFTPKHKLNH